MMSEIAVVGIACRYPDARSTQELWENVLAQRQAFRRFPTQRLHIEDYFSQDKAAPDTTYASQGAFIENYEFDRVRFRISGSTYRSSDLTHWLALDIASRALIDAGFSSPADLPSHTTGVIVGNTLTGEFSRANGLRLRWPYVRRVVAAALQQEGWTAEHSQVFLKKLETTYKEPFAPVGEETLAGGLSNIIAGRICNYFDLKGGGYTVDGACSSSLLAITTACSALAAGDIDLALAGGVDLSLDPFEIVGFAKTAALATETMRVYDARSNGFIPGEGCGFVILMRYEDALAQQRRIYALVRGWGISSDGSGGITRPEVEGQLLSLTRAYRKAEVGIASVAYFEGHGTGTSVGDATELRTLSQARLHDDAHANPATIGSIKANIGHTKAAAGVAGFIKATMALFTQIIPPTTGTTEPHPELSGQQPQLMVREKGALWPAELPLRAAVSAMGFGGINTHLMLEGASSRKRTKLTEREQCLLSSGQDAEVILLADQDVASLQQQVAHLLTYASQLSQAEITDLAMHLTQTLRSGPVRAAVVASTPSELTRRLERLNTLLERGVATSIDVNRGVYIGQGNDCLRIGFLFPGQSSPVYLKGGLFRRRFAFVDDLYTHANLPTSSDGKDTKVAQPAIVTASLAALRILHALGITANVGVGHSLGELTALHWAGAFDEETALQLATFRGEAMSTLGDPTGTMVSIMAPLAVVERLIAGTDAVIAGVNAPRQTVVSGKATDIAKVVTRVQAEQGHATYLKVSHAFHSPLVATAVQPFAAHLAHEVFQPLQRTVISTVTASSLQPDADVKGLLCEQITSPVQFAVAVRQATAETDLLIEVGPGKILSGLAAECGNIPAIALDAGGPSVKGLLHAAGAAFALGVPLKHDLLCANRFSRPFDLNWQPHFFANPCEQAPLPGTEITFSQAEKAELVPENDTYSPDIIVQSRQKDTSSIIELVRQLVAERVELPVEAVGDGSRMLSDLHLNSITVSQIVAEAARSLSILPPIAPTEYADSTVAEIAQALDEVRQTGGTVEIEEQMRLPVGVDSWIRAFEVAYIETPLASNHSGLSGQAAWNVLAPLEYPFGEALKQACATLEGEGVLVCLPSHSDEQHLPLLLQGIHEVLHKGSSCHFVLVQHGSGGAGIVRTLFVEMPKRTVCVIDVPPTHPLALDWVLAEIRAGRGYSEAVYDDNGKRSTPTLQLLGFPAEVSAPLALGPSDVLLVTGGGKGIAAECALSLSRETGIQLALLGRSQPSNDTVLAENLARFTAAGVDFRYVSVDVTDAEAVRQAVQEIEMNLGSVTAILHGAGTNTPKLLSTLEDADMRHTLAPKVHGLEHILSAVNPAKICLLVTFGSVIARTGMQGEGDYALANDWLARLTEEFQTEYPACRCLCLEWSVWSSIGMGERLGTIDALMREGIMPISLDMGVAYFQHLLRHRMPGVRLVVANRFGTSPVLQLPTPELPLLRFLEQPRIYYPEIELVVDVELSTATDLYLEDHKFRSERLLPAVVGLEAMAQIAMAVTVQDRRPHFENVHLDRPIVVPEKAALKIRIAALVQESGKVDVVLRSEETAFQVDHFRATCHFNDRPLERLEYLSSLPEPGTEKSKKINLHPAYDLYGSILFHQGRFQRVHGYHYLRATACVAEITSSEREGLFAHYLPSQLMLGDFTSRDAVIHCIQACIPHGRLLPIAIEEIRFMPGQMAAGQTRFVYARERFRRGNDFTYDLEVRTEEGNVEEQWLGLQLRQVEALPVGESWHEALLGPYIERKLSEFFPESSIRLVIQSRAELSRHGKSDEAFHTLLGSAITVQRRPNGKPTVMDKHAPVLTASHHEHFTLAMVSPQPVACDLESVTARPSSLWQDMLGPERYRLATFIASQTQEELHIAAARMWGAGECLRKVGAMTNTPLTFEAIKEDGWILLKAGSFAIATYITSLHDGKEKVVITICSEIEHSRRDRLIAFPVE